MKVLLFVFFLFYCFTSNAQKYVWYDGYAKFNDGSVLRGKMAYDPLSYEGLLLIKDNDVISTYTPKQVELFIFSDESQKDLRKFYSFVVEDQRTKYKRKYFLEVLFENKFIALLARDHLIASNPDKKVRKINQWNTTNISSRYLITSGDSHLKLIYTHTQAHTVLNKKLIYDFFGKFEEEMKIFVRENKLDLKKKEDLIQALERFSYLKEKT